MTRVEEDVRSDKLRAEVARLQQQVLEEQRRNGEMLKHLADALETEKENEELRDELDHAKELERQARLIAEEVQQADKQLQKKCAQLLEQLATMRDAELKSRKSSDEAAKSCQELRRTCDQLREQLADTQGELHEAVAAAFEGHHRGQLLHRECEQLKEFLATAEAQGGECEVEQGRVEALLKERDELQSELLVSKTAGLEMQLLAEQKRMSEKDVRPRCENSQEAGDTPVDTRSDLSGLFDEFEAAVPGNQHRFHQEAIMWRRHVVDEQERNSDLQQKLLDSLAEERKARQAERTAKKSLEASEAELADVEHMKGQFEELKEVEQHHKELQLVVEQLRQHLTSAKEVQNEALRAAEDGRTTVQQLQGECQHLRSRLAASERAEFDSRSMVEDDQVLIRKLRNERSDMEKELGAAKEAEAQAHTLAEKLRSSEQKFQMANSELQEAHAKALQPNSSSVGTATSVGSMALDDMSMDELRDKLDKARQQAGTWRRQVVEEQTRSSELQHDLQESMMMERAARRAEREARKAVEANKRQDMEIEQLRKQLEDAKEKGYKATEEYTSECESLCAEMVSFKETEAAAIEAAACEAAERVVREARQETRQHAAAANARIPLSTQGLSAPPPASGFSLATEAGAQPPSTHHGEWSLPGTSYMGMLPPTTRASLGALSETHGTGFGSFHLPLGTGSALGTGWGGLPPPTVPLLSGVLGTGFPTSRKPSDDVALSPERRARIVEERAPWVQHQEETKNRMMEIQQGHAQVREQLSQALHQSPAHPVRQRTTAKATSIGAMPPLTLNLCDLDDTSRLDVDGFETARARRPERPLATEPTGANGGKEDSGLLGPPAPTQTGGVDRIGAFVPQTRQYSTISSVSTAPAG